LQASLPATRGEIPIQAKHLGVSHLNEMCLKTCKPAFENHGLLSINVYFYHKDFYHMIFYHIAAICYLSVGQDRAVSIVPAC